MKTRLNNFINNYMKNTNIKDINIETLSSTVPNILIFDDFGTLAHAAVRFNYQYKKILKLLNVLFENGLNPNYKGLFTGYTFLHQAFLGYIDETGKINGYSQEFMIDLLLLAKKYGFNFNKQDNHGETIVHSAILSSTYKESVIPILGIIKDDFNFQIKGEYGRNIYEALVEYENNAEGKILERLSKDKEKVLYFVNSK